MIWNQSTFLFEDFKVNTRTGFSIYPQDFENLVLVNRYR